MERESQYTISSVKKALKVLKLFDSAHKSMTLTEISERADMRKGTMVRVLTTLEEEGFVRYDEISKRYSLGMSIYVLSSNAFQFISVVEAARPYLEKVTTELNLIAHLSVLEGEKIVLIDRVVPNANAVVFDLNSKIGGEVEAHNTGAGRCSLPILRQRSGRKLSVIVPLNHIQRGPSRIRTSTEESWMLSGKTVMLPMKGKVNLI